MIRAAIERFTVAPPRAVGNARARWTARHGLLVTLTDDDGAFGQGECSPLPGYSPDALDACELALQQAFSKGVSPSLPSARFALSCATMDLDARRRGVPLAEALGVGGAQRVARSALVGAASDDALVDAARAAVARGCATVKVKVGAPGAFARELDGLMALRNAIGTGCSVRLDANGAWGVTEARARLAALAGLRPELVEQPVAGADVFALGACAVPWAVDECLQDPAVAERVLSAPPEGCVAVVLKPPLLGGLREARDMALRAQRAGLGVIVTHLFDGPVAMAAACALALSLPTAPWPCGLDMHPAIEPWGSPPPQLAHDGWITRSALAGTGLPRLAARQIRAL